MKVKIPVSGMSCGGCVANVERVLLATEGVQGATASLDPGAVEVEALDSVPMARLVGAIEGAGYDVPTSWDPAAA